jgi:K+-sensing histidine kinase KdpD
LPIILGQCRKAFRVTSFLDFFAKVSRGEKIKATVRSQSLGSLWKILIESLLDHRYTVGRHVGVNFDANDLDLFRKKHEDVRLLLDLKLTEQVIDAVVGNAFKYTQRGEVVTALGELEDSQFVLKIISRGVGLSPEEARLCTQKFWRGEEAKDVDADGSGLGLFLTSLIMEAQAGSLTPFPTTAGGDTCMILRFPLHQSVYRL